MSGMVELIVGINDKTGEPLVEDQAALSAFFYENGYRFSATDLGDEGVKIELVHKQENGGAIILPPGKAQECGEWLLETLGQKKQNLPEDLPDILEMLLEQKVLCRALNSVNKKKIQKAVKALKSR